MCVYMYLFISETVRNQQGGMYLMDGFEPNSYFIGKKRSVGPDFDEI